MFHFHTDSSEAHPRSCPDPKQCPMGFTPNQHASSEVGLDDEVRRQISEIFRDIMGLEDIPKSLKKKDIGWIRATAREHKMAQVNYDAQLKRMAQARTR